MKSIHKKIKPIYFDIDGNSLNGFPVNFEAVIVGSIIFSDIDNDGVAELIGADNAGKIHIMNMVLW